MRPLHKYLVYISSVRDFNGVIPARAECKLGREMEIKANAARAHARARARAYSDRKNFNRFNGLAGRTDAR